MFVGHHCDAEENYNWRRETGRYNGGSEDTMDFWKGIQDLFKRMGNALSCSDCFFTNIYPALVQGKNASRPSRGGVNSLFAIWCRDFLKEQIKLMNPKLMVLLGGTALIHVKKMAWPDRTGREERKTLDRTHCWFPDGESGCATPIVHTFPPLLIGSRAYKKNGRIRKNGKKVWMVRGCTDYDQLVDREAELLAACLRNEKIGKI